MTTLPSPNRLRWLALALVPPLVASCVTLTSLPRTLSLQADGTVRVQSLPCAARAATHAPQPATGAALDPASIRVLTWNLHKEGDPGWERDLARFARGSDVLLLQEVVLQDPLRQAIEDAGLRWTMASSFLWRDDDIGVLTAARAVPSETCMQRTFEPLIGLPKSAVVSWFPLAGTASTLAVVNVHAINFTLTLGAYGEQMAALGDTLAAHRGPIVFGGDLNTWSDARLAVVRGLAARLELTEVRLVDDRRALFLDKDLDYLFVRDLAVTDAHAIPVKSSDHNPVAATLRYAPRNGAAARDRPNVVRLARGGDNVSTGDQPATKEYPE